MPKDLLEPIVAARATANDMPGHLGDGGAFSSWRAAILEEKEVLISLDPSFLVEVTFLSKFAAAWYRDGLQAQIMSAFPSASKTCTPKQAHCVSMGVVAPLRRWGLR